MPETSKLHVCGRLVNVKCVEKAQQFEVFSIDVLICNRNVLWELVVYRLACDDGNYAISSFDVTPVLSSLENVKYSPYSIGDKVLAIENYANIAELIYKISELLIEDFLQSQRRNLRDVAAEGMRFMIDILQGIQDAAFLVEYTDMEKVTVELPVFAPTGLLGDQSESEYLSTITKDTPILLCITLSRVTNKVNTQSFVIFPDAFASSRTIDIPKWDAGGLTVFEYISLIQTVFISSWSTRQRFVKQLQKISAVYEFDAIDFSYVAFVLRVKLKNMFSMCSVELKLLGSFPKEPPLITFFDMQTSLSSIIETNELIQSGHFNNNWSPERLADDAFLFCYEKLHFMTFGTTGAGVQLVHQNSLHSTPLRK